MNHCSLLRCRRRSARHLIKAGDPVKGVSRITPDPHGRSSSLIGMRIICDSARGGVWCQGGRTFPALMHV